MRRPILRRLLATLAYAVGSFAAFFMYGGAVLSVLQAVAGFDTETQAQRMSFALFVTLYTVAFALPCVIILWKSIRQHKRAGALGLCIGAVTAFWMLQPLLHRAFAGKF